MISAILLKYGYTNTKIAVCILPIPMPETECQNSISLSICFAFLVSQHVAFLDLTLECQYWVSIFSEIKVVMIRKSADYRSSATVRLSKSSSWLGWPMGQYAGYKVLLLVGDRIVWSQSLLGLPIPNKFEL